MLEGHEEAEDYRVSFNSHYDKIKRFVEKDVNTDKFPFKIFWREINEENWNQHVFDEDGAPIEKIDYHKSKVQLKPFLNWCVGKKIPFSPQLLGFEVNEPEKVEEDKDLNTMVLAAIYAGAICEGQGTEIKKEDLYAKVKRMAKISGPKFDCIWRLIPDNYKLGAGNPSTVVKRGIKGGVIAGISLNNLDRNNLSKSIKSLLKSHGIENIDADYFNVIVEEITAWTEKDKPAQ